MMKCGAGSDISNQYVARCGKDAGHDGEHYVLFPTDRAEEYLSLAWGNDDDAVVPLATLALVKGKR